MTQNGFPGFSPTNPNIKEIQTIPERRPDMPYAPPTAWRAHAVFCSSRVRHHRRCITSTRTTSANTIIPTGSRTRPGVRWRPSRAFRSRRPDLDRHFKGHDETRDQDGMVAVLKEYFGTWTPASTTICINQLSTPGARIELDVIAAFPPGNNGPLLDVVVAADGRGSPAGKVFPCIRGSKPHRLPVQGIRFPVSLAGRAGSHGIAAMR